MRLELHYKLECLSLSLVYKSTHMNLARHFAKMKLYRYLKT